MKDLITIFIILYLMQLFFIFTIMLSQHDSNYKPIATKKQLLKCLVPFLVLIYLLGKAIILVIIEVKKLKLKGE